MSWPTESELLLSEYKHQVTLWIGWNVAEEIWRAGTSWALPLNPEGMHCFFYYKILLHKELQWDPQHPPMKAPQHLMRCMNGPLHHWKGGKWKVRIKEKEGGVGPSVQFGSITLSTTQCLALWHKGRTVLGFNNLKQTWQQGSRVKDHPPWTLMCDSWCVTADIMCVMVLSIRSHYFDHCVADMSKKSNAVILFLNRL